MGDRLSCIGFSCSFAMAALTRQRLCLDLRVSFQHSIQFSLILSSFEFAKSAFKHYLFCGSI